MARVGRNTVKKVRPKKGFPQLERPEGRQVWTFSSSGWLFVYFFGVAQAIRDLGLHRDIYAVGSSGGACAGGFLFFDDIDLLAVLEYVKECATKARSSWRHAFKLTEYVRGSIERFCPPNGADCVNGNMEISVTLLPWLRNVHIKEFEDNVAMRDAILASSCITPLAGPPIWLDKYKAWAMDGIFSDFQLLKGVILGRSFFTMHMEDAITVCPFYVSRADIKPSQYIPVWWALYPPEPSELDRVYHLGYKDALNWLNANGRIPYGMMNADGTSGRGSGEEAPGWWKVLHESAESVRASASVYEQELEVAVKGFMGRVKLSAKDALKCLLWCLVLWELWMQSAIAALIATISPLLPDESVRESWKRFSAVFKSALSPRVLLKTVPALGSRVNLHGRPQLEKQLQDNSFFYRLFYYLL